MDAPEQDALPPIEAPQDVPASAPAEREAEVEAAQTPEEEALVDIDPAEPAPATGDAPAPAADEPVPADVQSTASGLASVGSPPALQKAPSVADSVPPPPANAASAAGSAGVPPAPSVGARSASAYSVPPTEVVPQDDTAGAAPPAEDVVTADPAVSVSVADAGEPAPSVGAGVPSLSAASTGGQVSPSPGQSRAASATQPAAATASVTSNAAPAPATVDAAEAASAADAAPAEASEDDELAGVDWKFNALHFRQLHERSEEKLATAKGRILEEQAESRTLRQRVKELEERVAELLCAPKADDASEVSVPSKCDSCPTLKKQNKSQATVIKNLEKTLKKKDAEIKALSVKVAQAGRDLRTMSLSNLYLGEVSGGAQRASVSVDDSLPPGASWDSSARPADSVHVSAVHDKDVEIARLREKLAAAQDAVVASAERGEELGTKLQHTRAALDALQKCMAAQAASPGAQRAAVAAGRSTSPYRGASMSPPGYLPVGYIPPAVPAPVPAPGVYSPLHVPTYLGTTRARSPLPLPLH